VPVAAQVRAILPVLGGIWGLTKTNCGITSKLAIGKPYLSQEGE
jgi:hypothetical protein